MKAFFLIISLIFLKSTTFGQTGATQIYTDYGGFWSSGVGAINPVLPDNDHNLLAFKYNGVTYSTGVNNGILGANGVSYVNTKFQAFPVKDIPLVNGNSVFAAYGKLRDNLPNAVGLPAPFTSPLQISAVLADGINGLNLGTGVTNIPSTSAALTFSFGAITDPTQIGDGKPDIIVSQIAQAGGLLDQLYFEDGAGNLVGNVISIDMAATSVPVLGNWAIDFYNPDGTNTTSQACCNQTRPVRLWAADAADFGITQANFTSALVLRFKLNGSSDPAFLAFNTAFIQIVSVNDDVASTNENTPTNINVLANDQPTNGLNINSMAITQQPANGMVSINTANGVKLITYTPNSGFTGTDTFKYQVCNAAVVPQCDDAIVTINVGSADVQVSKTANTLSPSVGGNVIFTITAKNNGPNTANNVVVRDVLPAGYDFVSTSPASGAYNSTTSNWAVGAMANNTTQSITITAKVKDTGPYANTATIVTSTLDPVEANNTATVTPVPVLSTDLVVTKTVDLPTPNVGANVVFTITARNLGASNATGVTVTDLLPNGYTYVSSSAPAGTTYNTGSGVWNIGALTSGATAITLTITAKVNATGTYTNTAIIAGAQTDPTSSNNTASAAPVPVPQADLSITKSVLPTNPDVNANVVFTIGLTNNGPSTAANVVITDLLPSGYTYVSNTATAGIYTNADGKWTLGSLNNSATATLTITAKVNTTGSYVNTATTSTTTADPITANNTASATPVPVAITDLKVTKTALKDIIHNSGTVNPGDVETFTITVTNNGPSTATNIIATDVLPTGYTYSSYTASIGTYNPTTGIWTVGSLSNAASATLTLNATILASGNYVNHVAVAGTEKDFDLANNEAYAPLADATADISISEAVNNTSPYVGQNVTFTLTATNLPTSTSDATQVTVTDNLPTGYTYVSSTASTGTYNPSNGIWYIGNLIKGANQVLTIVAKVNATGNYLNTTSVMATQTDPDVTNNNAQTITTPIASADLAVVKSINNAALNTGNGNFTIVVTNNGPSTANNVLVNDALPSGYNFTSSSATIGAYIAGVWTIGNLANGASATLTLNSTLNASGNYVNTASVNGTTYDSIISNNSFSAQPAPLAPTGAAAQTFCEIANPKVSNLAVTGSNIIWYTAASGGSVIPLGNLLQNGSKYYASQTIAGAESANRLEVTVTITATAAPTATLATQTFCEITAATLNNLQIVGTNIKWYDAVTAGNLLISTTPLINGATYYATQTLNGCESLARKAIIVGITTTAVPTGSASQSFCEISGAKIADLAYTATGLIKWYENATTTVVLSAARPLEDGVTYYATQTLNGCESAKRFAVKVNISSVVAPVAAAAQNFCTGDNPKVSNLVVTGSGIAWYGTSSGGTPLANTANLISGAKYYGSQVVNGCESKNRVAVLVTISNSVVPILAAKQSFCATPYYSLANVAITGANVTWYADSVSASPIPITTLLVDGATYYATQTTGNCESPRVPVTVELRNCAKINPSLRIRTGL